MPDGVGRGDGVVAAGFGCAADACGVLAFPVQAARLATRMPLVTASDVIRTAKGVLIPVLFGCNCTE
jgi:hypothetical protein